MVKGREVGLHRVASVVEVVTLRERDVPSTA